MAAVGRFRAGRRAGVTGRRDLWIRRTTIGSVAMLALIAGTVSYLHMHALVALHGQPGWVAALTPLSVDGMIVAWLSFALIGSYELLMRQVRRAACRSVAPDAASASRSSRQLAAEKRSVV